MKRLSAFVLLAAACCVPEAATAETIRQCELTVAGKTYIQGPCDYDPIGGGDFIIRQDRYFAYVYVSPQPNGYWNGDPPGDRAHEPLGDLSRSKGCWSNATAKVCAER